MSKNSKQIQKHINIEIIILVCLIIGFVLTALYNYDRRVEVIKEDDVKATTRTTTTLELQWEAYDKIEQYKVFYKKSGDKYKNWNKKTIDNSDGKEKIEYTIKNLEEGTEYTVLIQTVNDINKKFKSEEMSFSTKTGQEIIAKRNITKVPTSKNFVIDAEAKTNINYESDNDKIASVNPKTGKVKIKKSGTVNISLTADENNDYVGAKKTIRLVILDINKTNQKKPDFHIIYTLTNKNCKVAKKIKGSDNAQVPQSLGYTGNKYIVAYGMSGSQRIITFDEKGKGKKVSVPKIPLGHPNGFTYSNDSKLCYCVRGWSNGCVVYNPKKDKYSRISIPYGCSGIAYDRKEKCFYTSSRAGMRKYSGDGKFKHQMFVGIAGHKGKVYTQDCGGHAGIAFHCMSGSNKHGTNYIDLYDMKKGCYIGSIKCNLGEVESAVADREGYLVVMSNKSGKTDCIYRTPINIEELSEEL